MASRIEDNVHFAGAATFADITLNDDCVGDDQVEPAAGIDASKLEHQHPITYSQPNTSATSVTQVIYRCYGATGTILDFRAGSIAAAVGAATVTVDLKKNGTTVLSGVITLDNGNAARVAEAGTLSVTTLAAGDVLEIVTVATAGGGTLPTGFFCTVVVKEDAN